MGIDPLITPNYINSFLLSVIAAVEDNTHIQVSLSGAELIPPFTLSRGQVFQFLAEPKKRPTPKGTVNC